MIETKTLRLHGNSFVTISNSFNPITTFNSTSLTLHLTPLMWIEIKKLFLISFLTSQTSTSSPMLDINKSISDLQKINIKCRSYGFPTLTHMKSLLLYLDPFQQNSIINKRPPSKHMMLVVWDSMEKYTQPL